MIAEDGKQYLLQNYVTMVQQNRCPMVSKKRHIFTAVVCIQTD